MNEPIGPQTVESGPGSTVEVPKRTEQKVADTGREHLFAAASKTIYLTFDDGPNDGTDAVVSVLESTKVKASFFLHGSVVAGGSSENIKKNEQRLKQLVKQGHHISNHLWKHISAYGDESPATLADSIERTDRRIARALGRPARSTFDPIRLPGDGRFNKSFVNALQSSAVPAHQGMGQLVLTGPNPLRRSHVGWSFEFYPVGTFKRRPASPDWEGTGVTADYLPRYSPRGRPRNGAIILLHDMHWVKQPALLRRVIVKLQELGYRFGTLERTVRVASRGAAAGAVVAR